LLDRVAPEHFVPDVIRKVAAVATVKEGPTDSRGWPVASDIAVIATGQAAWACSFRLPKKPHSSFWVAGIVWGVVMVISPSG
jgi:hypothetical protein